MVYYLFIIKKIVAKKDKSKKWNNVLSLMMNCEQLTSLQKKLSELNIHNGTMPESMIENISV